MNNAQSYECGSSSRPLIGCTIGRYFDSVCEDHGDELALVVRHQAVRWTYAQLRERVDAVASALLEKGLELGDRVGIWSHNRAEWTIMQFATAKAGLILVNINPAYRSAELGYALNKVGCKALVASVAFKTSRYIDMLREIAPELATAQVGNLRAAEVPHLRLVISLGDDLHPGCLPFSELLACRPDTDRLSALAVEIDFDSPVNIQFTSGTTGQPKGATLSHHNILNNGFSVGEAIGLKRGDRLCIPVPLYHCFGMVMGNLACLTHASAMIYPGEGFEPRATLEAVQAERCDGLYGVPTMFIAMLDHPEFASFDLSSLRTGIMAGSLCPTTIMQRVIDDMHMSQVTIAYGMTETSPVSFQSGVHDDVNHRVTTVGRIQPHLEAKVIDQDGRIVPRGTPGELCTRGYSVMIGYWGEPERTAEVLNRGWMRTGDLAEIDANGYCRIVGRIKDMVIRGGENIYPREIEEALYKHPGIEDVQIVGVPDQKYGEELAAIIIRKPQSPICEDDVRDLCRARLAHYKMPKYIRFVEEFPLTVTGKVQKFILRDQLIAELGIDS